jgi:cytochrome c6
MKKCITLAVTLSAICLSISAANGAEQAANGEELFKQHCNVCHPNGGNIINPKDTLRKGEREVNTVDAIVGRMRHPEKRMPTFDSNFLPDNEAKAIAEYILKAF